MRKPQPWQYPPRPCSVCEIPKRTKGYTEKQWKTSLVCRKCQKAIKEEKARRVEPRKKPPAREMLEPISAGDLPALARLAAAVLADSINIITGAVPAKTARTAVDPDWERRWWDTDGPEVWLETCGISTSLEEARAQLRRL